MFPFQRIGVVARLRSREVVESLNRLVAFLKRDGREVVAEGETAKLLDDHSIEVVDGRTLKPDAVDLVIVVGGDGSMLGAIRALAGLGLDARLMVWCRLSDADLAALPEPISARETCWLPSIPAIRW